MFICYSKLYNENEPLSRCLSLSEQILDDIEIKNERLFG